MGGGKGPLTTSGRATTSRPKSPRAPRLGGRAGGLHQALEPAGSPLPPCPFLLLPAPPQLQNKQAGGGLPPRELLPSEGGYRGAPPTTTRLHQHLPPRSPSALQSPLRSWREGRGSRLQQGPEYKKGAPNSSMREAGQSQGSTSRQGHFRLKRCAGGVRGRGWVGRVPSLLGVASEGGAPTVRAAFPEPHTTVLTPQPLSAGPRSRQSGPPATFQNIFCLFAFILRLGSAGPESPPSLRWAGPAAPLLAPLFPA